MKLASLSDGSRDGELVVVSRDIMRYVTAADIAPTMQAALDRWSVFEPLLHERFSLLDTGRFAGRDFAHASVAAPLPRAFGFLDGSAFDNHGQLMGRALNVPADAHPPGAMSAKNTASTSRSKSVSSSMMFPWGRAPLLRRG